MRSRSHQCDECEHKNLMGRTAGLMSQTGCDTRQIIAFELIAHKDVISKDVTTVSGDVSSDVTTQISYMVFNY